VREKHCSFAEKVRLIKQANRLRVKDEKKVYITQLFRLDYFTPKL
jgi:hypothetical protein